MKKSNDVLTHTEIIASIYESVVLDLHKVVTQSSDKESKLSKDEIIVTYITKTILEKMKSIVPEIWIYFLDLIDNKELSSEVFSQLNKKQTKQEIWKNLSDEKKIIFETLIASKVILDIRKDEKLQKKLTGMSNRSNLFFKVFLNA